ncbi:hypothetical protein V2J09_013369 [Rumex salicifolius]
MAVAKDRAPPCSFSGSYMLEGASTSPLQFPSLSSNPCSALYSFEEDHYHKQLSLQGDDSADHKVGNSHHVSHSPPLSSSGSATFSNGFAIHGGGSSYPQPEEAHSLNKYSKDTVSVTATTNKVVATSYVGGFTHTNGSFLSFQPQNCYNLGQPNDHYPLWEGSSPHEDHHQRNMLKMTSTVVGVGVDYMVFEEPNYMQTTSSGAYNDASSEWLYGKGPVVAGDSAQESDALEQTSLNKKRPLMKEENMQNLKKQCTWKQINKSKISKSEKDPQSIAAKNRRERISERLKILQDLVPNGSKVDLVTMLEKAISYVKFLQLQVKVLATDEFWPEGGGKLPDITQVREAIDDILSTQRDNKHSTPSNEKVIEEIVDYE